FARSMARMWTSVICSSFAWHLPVPVRHHTTPLEGGIHPISSDIAHPLTERPAVLSEYLQVKRQR
ncbi:hypothetical protein, partial [Sphingomonas lacusdianchii]|uniref:hypothetical protein n=1 Tax=Sphingomonas lacusdianchii TaxID=2917992 RepID=UPI001F570DB5